MELITALVVFFSTLVMGGTGGFIFALELDEREKKKSEVLNPPCGNQHLNINGEP